MSYPKASDYIVPPDQTKFHPGDQVRVLRNNHSFNHPIEQRELEVGDILEVSYVIVTHDVQIAPHVEHGEFLFHKSTEKGMMYFSDLNDPNYYCWIPADDVELVGASAKDCVCDIFLLMTTGCQCGSIQKETAKQS